MMRFLQLSDKKLQELKQLKEKSPNQNVIESLDAKYFVSRETGKKFSYENISNLLENSICSFQEILDKLKESNGLEYLLDCPRVLKDMIDIDKLTRDDLKYFLKQYENAMDLSSLCSEWQLITRVLEKSVLDLKLVESFNSMLANDKFWSKDMNISSIFDLIEHEQTNLGFKNDLDAKKILELNELNKKTYLLNSFNLDEEQRAEILELIKNNEVARNKLRRIAENHLESNYDFDSLLVYLKKREKKSLMNI